MVERRRDLQNPKDGCGDISDVVDVRRKAGASIIDAAITGNDFIIDYSAFSRPVAEGY